MNAVRKFSLAFLTVPDIGPLDAIRIAAETGYQLVGLRLMPATPKEAPYPLLSDERLLREAVAATRDLGVAIGDLEIIRLSPGMNMAALTPAFDRACRLGGNHMTVVNDDPEENRTIDSFARLSEAAAPFGLTINLEPMPWTRTRTLSQAVHILEGASQPNTGILIDSLHFFRGGSRLEQLQALPRQWLNVFQLSDAPAAFDPRPDVIRHQARTARLMPGQGELDLTGLIEIMPPEAIVSIEVPNRELLRTTPPRERAALALAATQQLYTAQSVPAGSTP